MFRKLARAEQGLSPEECVKVLESEPRGVLSVTGTEGYPYGMPMDFYYEKDTGRLFFHSGRYGHRSEALSRDRRVSFCVYDGGYRREGEWALNIKSVIVFGRVEEVTDRKRAMELCRRMSYKYTPDDEYIEAEIAAFADATFCFELVPDHISGKLVNEA